MGRAPAGVLGVWSLRIKVQTTGLVSAAPPAARRRDWKSNATSWLFTRVCLLFRDRKKKRRNHGSKEEEKQLLQRVGGGADGDHAPAR